MSSCQICNRESTSQGQNPLNMSILVNCTYCGNYVLKALNPDEYEDTSKFYKVSSWIREQNDEFNITPKIDEEKFNELLDMRDKKVQEKFDLMMIYLSKVDLKFNIDIEEIIVKCWMKDIKEIVNYFQKALDNNYINGKIEKMLGGFPHLLVSSLTFDGLQYLESLDQPNKFSKNIFVAFNFSDELNDIFNTHVKEAIEELGFTYTIVNQSSTDHDKAISDEIIAKLKSSKIVIADFTNHRNSVYFEAGFAMGMKIPIIWTCKKGHIDELSFDTRQYPHLEWSDGEDLKKQIRDRIQVII